MRQGGASKRAEAVGASEAMAAPRNLRQRWGKSRADSRATFAGLPRAFGLVWTAHKGFTVGLALFTVLGGVLPVYVALQAIARRLTLGDLTLYTQAVGNVQSSFQGILGGISSLYEGGLYLNNLFEFLDYEPKIRDRPDAVPLVFPLREGIEFRDVSFTYPGKDAPALRGVSFRVALDETVALVGQNGAGKTTIVKLLARLYDPDEGQILVNGRDIREYTLASLHAAIG